MKFSLPLWNVSLEERYRVFILANKFRIFFFVVIIQLLLNCYGISGNSLWYDECFSVYCATKPISEIITISKNDVNPPLYALILHYWILIFGDSEFSVRFLSALFMSLANGILFLFTLRFFNWQAALFSIGIFFTSNAFFYYAQEARVYALVMLLAVCSHYLFFYLLTNIEDKRKASLGAFFLGITYSFLFYLHFLSCFLIIGHVLSIPFFIINKKLKSLDSMKISLKFIKYYFISAIVLLISVLPFYNRFLFLVQEGGKKMWLQKPQFESFKITVYELFNTKEVYQTFFCVIIVILISYLFFKNKRHTLYSTLIFFSVLSGPVLLFIIYKIASVTPIFLLRYVLFTFIGFILLISYVFSLLKVRIELKIVSFLLLISFSFSKMTIPKEIKQDYKGAVNYLYSVQDEKTLITTDVMDLFAYYYDRDIFKISDDSIKETILLTKNIFFQNYDLDWPKKLNFDKYKYIYYTESFAWCNDGNAAVLIQLNEKFKFIKRISNFYGVNIILYENSKYIPAFR